MLSPAAEDFRPTLRAMINHDLSFFDIKRKASLMGHSKSIVYQLKDDGWLEHWRRVYKRYYGDTSGNNKGE